MSGLLLHHAEINGHPTDVRITGGQITRIGAALPRRPGERVVECRGGALIPGLCDHHLHLHALAAWNRSVRSGPPHVTDLNALSAALRQAAADEHGWIRGVGYAESVAGDLDAAALDRLRADRPVRIQHRSGAMWTLNSAAIAGTGLATADHPGIERDAHGSPTGRLWRADDWLRSRLPPTGPVDLAPIGRDLARLGITAVTDATPDLTATTITSFIEQKLPQRLHLLGAPADVRHPRITVGPYKIVLADSGLPSLDDLTERIRRARDLGRAVAVHCVTREALLLLLAAFGETGTEPGDRIEHAALVPLEIIDELSRHGLRVVTQPGFLADRGDDYLRDIPPEDLPDLYRCGSLMDAGVPVGLSSDAPYGPLDPWTVMDAAVHRRTRSGAIAGKAEAVSPRTALRSYLTPPDDPGGTPRRVRAGATADLVLLHVPLAEALASLSAENVHSVIINGHLVKD